MNSNRKCSPVNLVFTPYCGHIKTKTNAQQSLNLLRTHRHRVHLAYLWYTSENIPNIIITDSLRITVNDYVCQSNLSSRRWLKLIIVHAIDPADTWILTRSVFGRLHAKSNPVATATPSVQLHPLRAGARLYCVCMVRACAAVNPFVFTICVACETCLR